MSNNQLKILIGIDFDDTAAAALFWALSIAEKSGAELHLAHIVKGELTAPADMILNEVADLPEGRRAYERVEHLAQSLGGKVSAKIHVRIGNPLEGLLAVVRDVRPDFLVMGRHNRGRIARAFIGSVSARLAAECPVPILLAPLPGSEKNLEEPPGPPPAADEGMPAVGRAVVDTYGDNSGLGTSPAGSGMGGVNAELRVRY
jgi:nucleotide-binding universal stress UspA family protein